MLVGNTYITSNISNKAEGCFFLFNNVQIYSLVANVWLRFSYYKGTLDRHSKLQPIVPVTEDEYRIFLAGDTRRERGMPQTATLSGRTLRICETTDEEAFAGPHLGE